MSCNCEIKYNGTTIVPQYTDSHDSISINYNGVIGTASVGQTKVMLTSGKMMQYNVICGDKILLTQGKVMSGDVEVKVSEPPKRVGGRIFYDNGSNGATYTFYDSSMNVLSTQTVSGLANAYYYTVSGTPSADRWYVYDNTSHTYSGVSITNGLSAPSLYWGYYGTSTGVTSNTIGSGKTNTQTILNRGVPTDKTPNIWGYIKDCRDNSLNGCNDWFIASEAEQDKLRNSGLVNWYSSDYIWSSVENDSDTAYRWYYDGSSWRSGGKNGNRCAFAARAF